MTFTYFGALAALLGDSEVRHDSMHPYFEAVRNNPIPGFAKWPVATLFAFLAQPQRHMFLMPQITKDFAEMMWSGLVYESQPNWRTYYSLSEMSAAFLEKLKPLGARDYMDIQTFIMITHAAAREKTAV